MCLTHFCWNEGDFTFIYLNVRTMPVPFISTLSFCIHLRWFNFLFWLFIIIPSFIVYVYMRLPIVPYFLQQCFNHCFAVTFYFYLYPLLNSVENFMYEMSHLPSRPLHSLRCALTLTPRPSRWVLPIDLPWHTRGTVVYMYI